MLGACVLLALAGGAAATVPTQEVTLAFPPAVAVPAAAALLWEGRGEPAPVVLARRGEAWVASLPADVVAAEEVWALAGDDWVSSPVRGQPVEALAVSAAGRLEGSVDVPPGGQPPAWGWVVVTPTSPPALPERFPLLVSSHRFSAFIPVGRWRAALEFPGFSRVELGEMAMAAGATLALPAPVVLHPAATARLHVVAVNAPGPPGPCRAWLFTAAELDAAQCALVYEGTGGWSGGSVADRLGGVYLEATAEGEGFAVVECPPWPAHLGGPVTLSVGEEAAVRAEVGPAAGVEVVAPFVVEFAQTHAQNRAVLAAYPRASRALSWCAFEAEFAADGEVLLPLLPRGEWELELLAGSRQPATRGSPILTERVVLAPGERQRLVLAQPPLVRGEVWHGDERATCLLTFEREDGEGWERSLWSDERGRFVLLGAEPGPAQVSARCARPSLEAFLPEVEVEPGTPLRLALPAGELLVTVVDNKGLPQRGRTVRLRLLEGPGALHSRWGMVGGVSRTSDAAGRARFAGLPAGRYRVDVWAADRRRGAAEVTLEDGERRRVRVSEQGTSLRLLLRDAGGRPVPGATLTVLGSPAGATLEVPPEGMVVDTDAAGEAELSLAAPLSHPLNILADVPGWGRIAFLLLPRPAEAEEPLELLLPPAGGEIELLAPEGDPDEPLAAFLVRDDGALAYFGVHPEERWARVAGEGRWVLGPLGPGSYRLLLLPWPSGPRGAADVAAFVRAAWAATAARGVAVTVMPGHRTLVGGS
jgi:hypothetical protein